MGPKSILGLPSALCFTPSADFVSLQGFDTATHALIVRDMVRWDEESAGRTLGLHRKLVIVSVVWAMHAIANLVSEQHSTR